MQNKKNLEKYSIFSKQKMRGALSKHFTQGKVEKFDIPGRNDLTSVMTYC